MPSDLSAAQTRAWLTLLRTPGFGAASLRTLIARVNGIRNNNLALQSDWSLKFHDSDNDQLLCYSKESNDRSNLILTVVNLDPDRTQTGFVTLPLDESPRTPGSV